MKFYISILSILFSINATAQIDSLNKIKFSAYGECYYSYDFSNPQNHEKDKFIYNHKRHNEINLNLIVLKSSYTDQKFRANLGLMAGNYAQYNLSEEPTWAQYIYEANVGIKMSAQKNIWLEVGIMPSHLGFETVVSADCWTLTRSMLAENSPYYETGVKIGYTSKNEKLYVAGMYLNGWQKIQRASHFQTPSAGTQLTYKPSEKILLSYNTFFGSVQPDTMRAFRQFHNFYLQYEPTNKWGILAGFDIGNDKFNPNQYGNWYSPVLIVRHSLNKKIKLAWRGEYYHDPKQIIIPTENEEGFRVLGISTNLDYDYNEKIKFRLEGKVFNAANRIFSSDYNNYSITTNLTFKL